MLAVVLPAPGVPQEAMDKDLSYKKSCGPHIYTGYATRERLKTPMPCAVSKQKSLPLTIVGTRATVRVMIMRVIGDTCKDKDKQQFMA